MDVYKNNYEREQKNIITISFWSILEIKLVKLFYIIKKDFKNI